MTPELWRQLEWMLTGNQHEDKLTSGKLALEFWLEHKQCILNEEEDELTWEAGPGILTAGSPAWKQCWAGRRRRGTWPARQILFIIKQKKKKRHSFCTQRHLFMKSLNIFAKETYRNKKCWWNIFEFRNTNCKDRWSCYITVDFAIATSRNGFITSNFTLHKETIFFRSDNTLDILLLSSFILQQS